MGYKLAASNGDTLAVPQLVLTHLTQTDGDTIRAALYILQTHDTDPRTMARALGTAPASRLPSAPCNTGPVPGCWSVSVGPPCPGSRAARVDLASVANDPYVAVLCRRRKASSVKR